MDPQSVRIFTRKMFIRTCLLTLLALAQAAGVSGARPGQRQIRSQQKPQAEKQQTEKQQASDRIPAEEFARIVQDTSEPGGFFHSDNFVSNELAYLSVVEKMRELSTAGGAYIGVGPEQNFTYIAKVKPRIAFIIDIRRQALVQHLMYKALFQLADDRPRFLSRLLSRPLTGETAPGKEATLSQLTEYFAQTPAGEQAYAANLGEIRKTIRDTFQVPLTNEDQSSLEYVYDAFRKEGLQISFRFQGWGGFPSLREILEQPGNDGKPGNFLASEDEYRFIRDLQRRNRVIPIVGDFAGPKALKGIGAYLRKNSFTVTAFYTSNVEQFLFQNGVFEAYADNVRSLPITENSFFIRAVPNRWRSQYPPVVGARMGAVLQKISVFVKDYDDGLYPEYWNLISTHSISPQ